MTDKLRAAAQMALEALEWSWGGEPIGTMEIDAINALRAALSEPLALVCEAALKPAASEVSGSTPEPVAHLWQHSETGRTRVVMPDQIITADATWLVVGPLYAHPQRQPLSDAEIDSSVAAARDALLDHIYEHGTTAEGVMQRVRNIARAIEKAHGISGEQK